MGYYHPDQGLAVLQTQLCNIVGTDIGIGGVEDLSPCSIEHREEKFQNPAPRPAPSQACNISPPGQFYLATVLSCDRFILQQFYLGTDLSCDSFILQELYLATVSSCNSFILQQVFLSKVLF